MATTELTAQNFEQTVLDNDTVFVDFWADWCGPCQRFAPVYEDVSSQHDGIVFAKVDTEAEQALAAAVNITSIPTLMAFRDGILVFRQPGALPKEAFQSLGPAGRGSGHGRRPGGAGRQEGRDQLAAGKLTRIPQPPDQKGPTATVGPFCCAGDAGEQRDVVPHGGGGGN